MPQPTQITETSLYVESIERSIVFYQSLLGCDIVRRDDRFCALRISEEQVLLLFFRGQSTEPSVLDFGGVVPGHDGHGPLHVCFGMKASEVTAWEAHLASLNLPVESRVDWPGGAISLYFRDPDGNSVELATPGLWV